MRKYYLPSNYLQRPRPTIPVTPGQTALSTTCDLSKADPASLIWPVSKKRNGHLSESQAHLGDAYHISSGDYTSNLISSQPGVPHREPPWPAHESSQSNDFYSAQRLFS